MTFEKPYFNSFFSNQLLDSKIQQQFSSVYNLPKKILAGTVNVSVKFADLGSLIWSDFEGETAAQPT